MKPYLHLLLVFVLLFAATTTAFSQSRTSRELEDYYIKKATEHARILAKATSKALAMRYGADTVLANELNQLLLDYQLQANKIISGYKGAEQESRLIQLALENDSLKQQVITLRTGAGPLNSAFSRVLTFKKSLVLSPAQVESIKKQASLVEDKVRNYRSKNAGVNPDIKPYESELLKILTEDQYVRFLLLKNRDQALKWAKSDWIELKQRGMTGGLDSVTTVREILNFDMNKLMLKERYAGDPAKLSIALTTHGKLTPEPLRQLRSARSHGNPATTNTVKSSFTW